MRVAGLLVIAILLAANPLRAAQTNSAPELEAFAARLVSVTSPSDQIHLLDENRVFFNADLVELLHHRGNAFYEARDFTNLLKYDKSRLLVATQLGDNRLIAEAALGLAASYNIAGEFASALPYFDSALSAFRALGDEGQVAESFNGKAIAQKYLGNLEAASTLLERSAAMFEKLGDKEGIARATLNLGNVYHDAGNNRQAIVAFRRTLELSRELKIDKGISFATNNLGEIYYDQGNNELALEFFNQSLEIKRRTGNSFDIINSLVNIAMADQDMAHFDAARAALDQALSLARPDDPRARVTVLNRSVRLLITQGKYAEALPQIAESLGILDKVEDRLLRADMLIRLAAVQIELRKPAEGIAAADEAAAIAARVQAPYFLGLAREMHGRAARALGNDDDALAALQESLRIYDELRGNVAGGPQQQQEFMQTMGDQTSEIVAILVAQHRDEEAFLMAERQKAQVLLGVLGTDKNAVNAHVTGDERAREISLQAQVGRLTAALAQAQDGPRADRAKVGGLETTAQKARLDFEEFETNLYAAHPELQVHRSRASPVSSTETAALLPDTHTAVLQYVIGSGKSFLFVIDRDIAGKARLQVYTLNIAGPDLTRRVDAFRMKIANRDLDFRDEAADLYKLLIAPASHELAGKRTLVIIPDGSLWELPFQVLQVPTGHYLLENYALFLAPSATVLSRTFQSPAKAIRDPELLAVGDTEVGRQLSGVYGADHTRVLAGMDAAEIAAKTGTSKYTVIHFAAHGFYDDRHPMYSYLELSRSGGDGRSTGRMAAVDMMSLDLRAQVVVLSACETGRGGVGGEGLLGMTWALSVAGVPTTVASQWKVDSASTTELMVRFHQALRDRLSRGPAPSNFQSKARALQQAELAIMKKPEYRHPFYWSAFVMVGDGF